MIKYPYFWRIRDMCFGEYAKGAPVIRIQVPMPEKVECRSKRHYDLMALQLEKDKDDRFENLWERLCAYNRESKRLKNVRKNAVKACFCVALTMLLGLLTVGTFAIPFVLYSPPQLVRSALVVAITIGCATAGSVLLIITLLTYAIARDFVQNATRKERP